MPGKEYSFYDMIELDRLKRAGIGHHRQDWRRNEAADSALPRYAAAPTPTEAAAPNGVRNAAARSASNMADRFGPA